MLRKDDLVKLAKHWNLSVDEITITVEDLRILLKAHAKSLNKEETDVPDDVGVPERLLLRARSPSASMKTTASTVTTPSKLTTTISTPGGSTTPLGSQNAGAAAVNPDKLSIQIGTIPDNTGSPLTIPEDKGLLGGGGVL